MKKLILIIFLLILLFPFNAFALTDTAKSTVVMDIDSGRVLYQKNMNEKRLIASITKIMTATIAIENGNINDIYKIGEEVLPMYGTNIYLDKDIIGNIDVFVNTKKEKKKNFFSKLFN